MKTGEITVERARAEDRDAIAALASAWPFTPRYYTPGADPDRARRVAAERLPEAASGADLTLLARSDGRVVGLLTASVRAWESRVVGRPAAMIDELMVPAGDDPSVASSIERALVRGALGALHRAHGVEHVTARVDTQRIRTVQVLEAAGFLTVDVVLHLIRDLQKGGDEPPVPGVTCRLHQEADVPALEAVGRTAYRHDRLHADPAIPASSADGAYGEWVVNACRGGLADAVVVGLVDDNPVGFVTVRFEERGDGPTGLWLAKIWLVGVAPGAQGRGVGRATLGAATAWARAEGARYLEVGTQLANHPALRLYSRAGFLPGNSVFAMRALISGSGQVGD